MKNFYFIIAPFFLVTTIHAQNEFHVFSVNHSISPGSVSGDGSLKRPWDLQTALNQKPKVINGGDIIWLHEGVYKGHFVSNIKSTLKDKYITVASFPNEWAILNGNVQSELNPVLTVKGSNVIYKDFEVTWLGEFSRNENDNNFIKGTGIAHLYGKNCKFINLIIHDNPGLGFGSWNKTAGTLVEYCMVYNNGYISKGGKGIGEGMYVQNSSDTDIRQIKNNIIFNNYYKGIEVWSANKRAKDEYVKNITLENNVIFNSGLPSNYRTVDNIIVASNDRNGINIAKNIIVKNNILYHNTDFIKNEVKGDAASLTIGFNKNAPVENVVVDQNIIIGGNNALRILYAKSLSFTNNILYSGYVQVNESGLKHLDASRWDFKNNVYFTKSKKPFRFSKTINYSFKNWASTFNVDANSNWNYTKAFTLENVLNISKNEYKINEFRIVLFDKEGNDVYVNFSNHNLKKGMSYTIRDVEDYKKILVSGILNDTFQVNFPMSVSNQDPYKTLNNFGVYIIKFENAIITETEEEKTNFITRFFKWLF